MINSFGQVFEASKANAAKGALAQRQAPALSQGQVRARIDSFAITANNVTYALFGEAMGYWKFFPAADDASFVVPVWGFATVTQSAHPQVKAGLQLYGYWPFASEVILEPQNVTPAGFSDGAEHRQSLHPFYNMMSAVEADPFTQGADDAALALIPALKPLFATAWLIEDFCAQEAFFGAEQIILTSASSKTALGTAACIRAAGRFKGKVIALTSRHNADFVAQTGLYDAVLAYEDIAALPNCASVLVDFAGNGPRLADVHTHLADNLKYSCQVGKTHAGASMAGANLPGPAPVLFFAPDHSRAAAKRMGAQGFNDALFSTWQAYLEQAKGWFTIRPVDGIAAAVPYFGAYVSGDVNGADVILVKP